MTAPSPAPSPSPSPSPTPSPTDPDGTLDRTPNGAVLVFERHLGHPVEAVWAAITEPALLSDWWLPFDAEITVDLRPGGQMVMTGTGDEPVSITCEILRVEPPVLLEHTHVDPGSSILWLLEPTETGCTLRVRHTVPDADAAIERCYLVGLHTSLGRLAPALAGTPAAWDWDGFAATQRRYAAAGLAPTLDDDEEAQR